jgi:hypothetical protein
MTSYFKVKICNENLKSHKFPGIDQILAEVIQAEGNTLCSEIHKLINSIWNKEVSEQWKESLLHQFMKMMIKLIVVITEECHY